MSFSKRTFLIYKLCSMKQVYGAIKQKTGVLNKGIVKIKVAAKEWVTNSVLIDFSTGAVITALTFSTGKGWKEIELAPYTYDYEEKPKLTKHGTVYEAIASGILNNNDTTTYQLIESIRYHELIVLCIDKVGDTKIIGNTEKGASIFFGQKTGSSSEQISVSISLETDKLCPYYNI